MIGRARTRPRQALYALTALGGAQGSLARRGGWAPQRRDPVRTGPLSDGVLETRRWAVALRFGECDPSESRFNQIMLKWPFHVFVTSLLSLLTARGAQSNVYFTVYGRGLVAWRL